MSVGARGWDTPRTDRRPAPDEDGDGNGDVLGAGPSKRRKTAQPTPGPRIRDDLTLDAFQRNYTSEDNASFAQIVDEENLRRREEKSWAWDAQRASETKRIAGDERRKLILDAATNGGWRVDALGRRLIGGLGEGARSDQGAWGDRKLITAGGSGTGSGSGSGTGNGNGDDAAGASDSDASPSDLNLSTALVRSDWSASDAPAGALIVSTASAASALAPAAITESSLPADHPLSRALATAGLPTTALVSTSDGAIVPHREAVSGSGDGRGRGDAEKEERAAVEKRVMGDEAREVEGTQQWKYKVSSGSGATSTRNHRRASSPKQESGAGRIVSDNIRQ
jgi:protein DGCR14